MNKRASKILIGCIGCASIVVLLLLIVLKFSPLSCELVSLDPIRFGSSQLNSFARDPPKPIRSHDETILMRISAYLEYNIQPEPSDQTQSGLTASKAVSGGPAEWLTRGNLTVGAQAAAGHSPSGSPELRANSTAGRPALRGPQPWAPNQISMTNPPPPPPQQQQQLGSDNSASESTFSAAGGLPAVATSGGLIQHMPPQTRVERRFLPLELKSIETRNFQEGSKHKYILNFNCTKINMVLAHQNDQVFIESMSLELRPSSRHETTCEVQLPPQGAFAVADSTGQSQSMQQQQAQAQPDQLANGTVHSAAAPGPVQASSAPGATGGAPVAGTPTTSGKQQPISSQPVKNYPQLARYYCARPLRYSCYHYSSKNGALSQSNGILLADLYINGIEFETSTSWQGKHKKVKSEFAGKRSECNMV